MNEIGSRDTELQPINTNDTQNRVSAVHPLHRLSDPFEHPLLEQESETMHTQPENDVDIDKSEEVSLQDEFARYFDRVSRENGFCLISFL